ncbi:2,3-dihydro-2,3-dihydroxybenzoate dehydrogenase [Vibrio anguillarum]|uniref:2,3-dihydro-2,3-dihydroxybenzoate dehydrogenase n=1 Tax=Vibrio anguillarum TaxID=55601 RepID=UPI00097E1EB7|nr:2,3-dihydro-2,3-dihydroxybenzoate dehydrogenase [Vibrio anguillarum]MBF4255536.1 2,3-dihydro-2,3-dihydroxybenzoate dehydrogenase [Vibrio anguillarum]MBF4279328.1 2,3-dihydro-2,3-dihydroxybenzoate dehydrogenase [Vibrio anguillarum]MBF4282574.1 2,3-dihydro-2,3-dihydroxybenzoate dehydrogenase [Vibrio anguillarum]MBF4286928.1 2,3-dihydro-2,3-dihydroxybenzoate dehydrogenase [Vibrio anguillarum]MBF4300704.1 2,3-dihydro-2,3-dihydroxybenzoate dehydrogenase [Vibrio anguillarum]
MMKLDETVLLTGAGQGIGYAVLESLLASGYRVVATDRNHHQLTQQLASLNERYTEQLHCYELDLQHHDDVKKRVQELNERYQFAHFISCAGTLHLGSITELSMSEIKAMFDVNTFGTLAALQGVTIGMKVRQRGNVIVIGSNSANTPRLNIGAYAASKSALHMLVKCAALELANDGIRCNIVSPGSTRTEMQTQLWNSEYGEREVIKGNLEQYRLGIPLGKMAEPEDIAGVVMFLMSNAASQITMHDLRVDGGATLDN